MKHHIMRKYGGTETVPQPMTRISPYQLSHPLAMRLPKPQPGALPSAAHPSPRSLLSVLECPPSHDQFFIAATLNSAACLMAAAAAQQKQSPTLYTHAMYGHSMSSYPHMHAFVGSQTNILRSHQSTVQQKAVPNDSVCVDLESWERLDVARWTVDEVIGWMIDAGKIRNIAVEDMNIHRFADCNGQTLILMKQSEWHERDPNNGLYLWREFRKLCGASESDIVEELLRMPGINNNYAHDPELPGSSQMVHPAAHPAGYRVVPVTPTHRATTATSNPLSPASQEQRSSVINFIHKDLYPNRDPPVREPSPTSQQLFASRCQSSKMVDDSGLTGLLDSIPLLQSLMNPVTCLQDDIVGAQLSSEICSPSTVKRKGPKGPRMNRGHKLWEFIRDALHNPATCPSVVKWENEAEGVFRIVESEKLARLWGQKKNNSKMTYEKLSRAMRTYYDKGILVPVPKTGLYPKKLIYKFGPGAYGDLNNGVCETASLLDEKIRHAVLSGRNISISRTNHGEDVPVYTLTPEDAKRFDLSSLIGYAGDPSSSSSSSERASNTPMSPPPKLDLMETTTRGGVSSGTESTNTLSPAPLIVDDVS